MLRDFATGVRLFGTGAGILVRRPRLLLLGAIPAAVTSVLVGGALLALILNIDAVAAAVTPFADDWAGAGRQTARVIAGVAILVGSGLVALVTFTALTLLIGGPFYEYIAETVEDSLGDPPPPSPGGWWRRTLRGLRDSALLVGVSVLCAVPLLVIGFVPVLGQTAGPLLGATVGGWLLALELVGVPFHRRGLRLGDRHRALRTRPGLALGVGMPTSVLCAIPFAAIVVMPVAVVAGVLLARRLLVASTSRQQPGPPVRSAPGSPG